MRRRRGSFGHRPGRRRGLYALRCPSRRRRSGTGTWHRGVRGKAAGGDPGGCLGHCRRRGTHGHDLRRRLPVARHRQSGAGLARSANGAARDDRQSGRRHHAGPRVVLRRPPRWRPDVRACQPPHRFAQDAGGRGGLGLCSAGRGGAVRAHGPGGHAGRCSDADPAVRGRRGWPDRRWMGDSAAPADPIVDIAHHGHDLRYRTRSRLPRQRQVQYRGAHGHRTPVSPPDRGFLGALRQDGPVRIKCTARDAAGTVDVAIAAAVSLAAGGNMSPLQERSI